MGLQDVTRDALLDAVDEYEDLGGDGFLAKYGFTAQADVTLDYVGRGYDAMAVVAAGHAFQTGTPLTREELRDREDEVAEHLTRLQLRVLCTPKAARATTRGRVTGSRRQNRAGASSSRPSSRAATSTPTTTVTDAGRRLPMPNWTLEPGDAVARRELVRHGDSMSRHIEPAGRTPNVLVFADPHKPSHAHDGWSSDGSAYFVTGEGKRGDQTWTPGNEALRTHAQEGRAVRLFEIEPTWRPGGKKHCYLGEFVLDPGQPYRMDVAPDTDGAERRVIVFKLVTADATGENAGGIDH